MSRTEAVNSAASQSASSLFSTHRRGGRFFNPWRPYPLRAADIVRWMLGRDRRRDRAAPPRGSPTTAGRWQRRPPVCRSPGWDTRASSCGTRAPPSSRIPTSGRVPSGRRATWLPECRSRRFPRRRLPSSRTTTTTTSTPGRSAACRPTPVDRAAGGRQLAAPARRARRGAELDWWEAVAVGPWRLTCLPAQHWSRRLSQPRDTHAVVLVADRSGRSRDLLCR